MKEYNNPGDISLYILRTYAYDSHGRWTSIKYLDNGSSDSVLESFDYTYDKDGMILSCKHINNLPAAESKINESRHYEYDAYGNLTKSTIVNHNNSDAELNSKWSFTVPICDSLNRDIELNLGLEEEDYLNETEAFFSYADSYWRRIIEEKETTDH